MALEDRYSDLTALEPGALGERFDATHKALNRPVRVYKIGADLDEAQRQKVVDVIRSVGSLVHPNIVSVIDADLSGDAPFFVFDRVGAQTVEESMSDGRLDTGRAVQWSFELLRAVHFAHAHGVLHHGLAPSRLQVDVTGALVIADFGVGAALAESSSRTISLDAEATPYLPIKVLRKPSSYDVAAERYAVAGLVYHLLTGEEPEPGETDLSEEVEDAPTEAAEAIAALLRRKNTEEDLNAAVEAFAAWAGSTVAEVVVATPAPQETADEEAAEEDESEEEAPDDAADAEDADGQEADAEEEGDADAEDADESDESDGDDADESEDDDADESDDSEEAEASGDEESSDDDADESDEEEGSSVLDKLDKYSSLFD